MRRLSYLMALLVWLGLPAGAYAQAAIAGAVKDASGAVLPGVTVEAASPALIEKIRTVVTDGTGQYRVENLRPGTYSVTFTLPGFSTVSREGVELSGSFTATVDAELRVGALEETITVSGESPVVDVQSTTRQQVMTREIVDAIPASRNHTALGGLIPGVIVVAGATDTGGAVPNFTTTMGIHGSRPTDQRNMQSGVDVGGMGGVGHGSRMITNMGLLQEVAFDYASVSAEDTSGGVRINQIPRDGGNTFSGTVYFNFANNEMQGSNLSQDLQDRGLRTPNSVKKLWDVNPGVGGPIMKDRVWFYLTARYSGADSNVPVFYNRNANKPDLWLYEPDTGRPATNETYVKDGSLRLAWQVTPRNKVGVVLQYQNGCECSIGVGATLSPESAPRARYQELRRTVVDWSSPVTNRVLLEANFVGIREVPTRSPGLGTIPGMISVTEQSNGLMYRGTDFLTNSLRWNVQQVLRGRVAFSYITGTHAFKVGSTHTSGYIYERDYDQAPLSYRFNNGVPNQLTMRVLPIDFQANLDHNLGLFAQDRWTIDRLTLTYGMRYDYFANSVPEQHLESAIFAPGRDLRLPAQSAVNWHDITPRLGASYDLFGTGKTAVKVSLNKYLEALSASGTATTGGAGGRNPVDTLVKSTTRNWADANRDYVPDCDLLNPAANGECGAMADSNLGRLIPRSTYDPGLQQGWGKRGFNWEVSAGVQHEILPQTSIDVSYFRRWYGNFVATDNRAVAATDFDSFTITAPADARLPDGGGSVISGLYDLKPARFGLVTDDFVTRAQNYGTQTEHWNGVDVSLSTRPRPGLILQGGISTGRTMTDNCELRAKLPELGPTNPYCHVETLFLTQGKGFASYTIPRVDVQLSGTFQSISGPELAANLNAPNALVQPSLGRSLSGNAANVTVNLVEPGTMYGERMNQVDLRVGKLVRVGRTRTMFSVDLYNALNANPVLTENSNFAAWRRPTSIQLARFAKINVQIDF